jgi:hypothetical protein
MSIAFPLAERWLHHFEAALSAERDPRTLDQWASLAAVSVPSLRSVCYLVGVTPRKSLLLARLCRAILMARRLDCRPADLLDVNDARTARSILSKAGIVSLDDYCSLVVFLERQTLVKQPLLLRELRAAMTDRDLLISVLPPANGSYR